MDTLDIALLHLKILPGEIEANRRALARLAEQAASDGAKIIVAPELSVSGYVTGCRSEVAPFVEELNGPTISMLAGLAKRHGVYICTGIAERERCTEIYYNSACALGPQGEVVAHHRKIASERRWASPGALSDQSRFHTPWGTVGLLICADTYFGLLPRCHALHGTDLLVVLANWPDCGLDPRELWRGRALENGFGIVACNRTGCEPKLDFTPSHSYAVTPDGAEIASFSACESKICHIAYPLQGGKFSNSRRKTILNTRCPDAYRPLSLNVNGLADFSALWNLPKPGRLDLHCVIGAKLFDLASSESVQPRLILIPPGEPALAPEEVTRLTQDGRTGLLARVGDGSIDGVYGLFTQDTSTTFPLDHSATMVDFGPARIALVQPEALRHPEMSVALSKQGCDLAVTATTETLNADDRLVLEMKTLARLAVAMLGGNIAGIAIPPVGHRRWDEATVDGVGSCHRELDTTITRAKHFEDCVDLPALLGR